MLRRRWTALWAAPLLALTLAAAGCGGDDGDNGPTGGDGDGTPDVTIEIVANNGANSYSPNPASVTAGQTVAWHNAHNQTHTATADDGSFNTGNIPPGGTSSPITMSAEGSFPYHCSLHPEMVGSLLVNP